MCYVTLQCPCGFNVACFLKEGNDHLIGIYSEKGYCIIESVEPYPITSDHLFKHTEKCPFGKFYGTKGRCRQTKTF